MAPLETLKVPPVLSPPPKEPKDADDDGLLTASEVAGLKLNADWVVLSACNTAAGEKLGAEALSAAKREKLERMWGAEVHDLFGMTEIGILGGDSHLHAGFHIWTDQALFEVVDEKTGLPVKDGEEGLMVITPLFTNNITPFLRWMSGDLVTCESAAPGQGPFSVFPIIRHAHRTSGFFKIKGVNIDHGAFEDLLFRQQALNDFKCEALTLGSGDILRVSVEIKRGSDAGAAIADLSSEIKRAFELTAEIVQLELGTLAKEFEASIKAPRIVDRRG